MKIGMLHVDALLKKNYPSAHLLLQIHDQILVECNKHESEEIKDGIQKTLESVVNWSIPLTVSVGIGTNWKDAE